MRPENGYPLRLIVPGWILTRGGKARQLSFVLEAKSVITSPSAGQRLPGPGFHEIRGLAWSGRGVVRRVEVSTDGGKGWEDASLQEPVLPRPHTRFWLAWRWDGREAVLQSRCTDETGYVQPTLGALVTVRGVNSRDFNNAIQSWRVAADGSVHNVHA